MEFVVYVMIWLEVIYQTDNKKVHIAQENSTMRALKSGVPAQDINDLPFKLQRLTVQLFADDTCLQLSNI